MDIEFSADAVEKRPELAVQIARIAAKWAEIEIALGILLAVVLETEARTGLFMYLALKGSAAQDATLAAAAEARLPKDMQPEFVSLLSDVRNSARQRNRVIHGLWGVSPWYADSLIHCNPDDFLRDVTNAITLHIASGSSNIPDKPSKEFVSRLRAYKKRDFVEIYNALSALQGRLAKFTFKVGEAHARRHALARALATPPEADATSAPPPESQTNQSEQS